MKKQKLRWTTQGRETLSHLLAHIKDTSSRILFYTDECDLEIFEYVFLPAVTKCWLGKLNPLWCQIIGPPGCGKTLHLEMLTKWDQALFLSSLTEKTLISGFRSEDEPDKDLSLIQFLNYKMLVIKDFTLLLQSSKHTRDAVIGQFRDAYDGSTSKAFGNIGYKQYESRFSMILAVTPVIDHYHSINQSLGERFVSRRVYASRRIERTRSAFLNTTGKQDGSLTALKDLCSEYVSIFPKLKQTAVGWPLKYQKRMVAMADFLSVARSHVQRERDGQSISSRPSPEVGTRIVSQLAQCAMGYAAMNGLEEIDERCWNFVAKIGCDSLPSVVSWVLFHVWDLTRKSRQDPAYFGVRDLLQRSRLGFKTTQQIVTDLHFNGVLLAKYRGGGNRNTVYALKPEQKEIIDVIGIFSKYEHEQVRTKDLIKVKC